ncbi:hypothetical protein EDC39_11551 [Geothermobacter ehrlichii]|uniref:Uncharacterized protein n=1 Tax=Geothermobacter ehrlichii TaxID=213224 RepID=A0A5D3WF89_9BACT|nr:hypothetical protein [Geothermobacter ehrlichii]TYO96105.1 hypothetical protein EDC39_11551 [Geothermobacter ehrlichii]
MTRYGFWILAGLILAGFVAGCSSGNSDAPLVDQAHPAGWIHQHADAAMAGLSDCQLCHGIDFTGSGGVIGCLDCHFDGPPFTVHPAAWTDVRTDHQGFAGNYSWTTCATAACHGVELGGGTVGPSCFNSSTQCHAATGGDPPAPHVVPYPTVATDPDFHGTDAKADLVYCRNCHGRPLNDFRGGFVADLFADATPEINTNGNCSLCHPEATAHPADWDGVDTTLAHFSSGNLVGACTLCHNLTVDTTPGNTTAGPFAGAPSCFSASWDSPNGTSGCHADGPTPHTLDGSYLAGSVHGPDAKADLDHCRDCHGDTTTDVNPRYNKLITDVNATGSIVNPGNGCEGCHNDATAHPSIGVGMGLGNEREVVNWYDVPGQRHNDANISATTCGLCHSEIGSGNVGGLCTGCHVSVPTGANASGCVSCHGAPPDGATAPNRVGRHDKKDHQVSCDVCHTNNGPGSAAHFTRPPDPQRADLKNQVDAVDGDLTFTLDASNVTCTNTCHGKNHNNETWY